MAAGYHAFACPTRRSDAERRSVSGSVLLFAVALTTLASGVELPVGVRGQAAVWLQPAGQALTIELSKQDLNIYPGPDRLVAQLFDAERSLLGVVELDDDGAADSTAAKRPQTGSLSVALRAPGPCRLEVSAPTSNDLVWGFASDAVGYAVEGQPLLNAPEVSAPVVFPAPPGAFAVRLSALHQPGVQTVELRTEDGRLVHSFKLDKAGVEQVCQVPADPARSGLWRLEIGKWDVKLGIDGVSFWTAQPEAWFDPTPYVHLLYPYQQTRVLNPGQAELLRYEVRNRGQSALTYRLAASAPAGVELVLSAREVTLPPRRSAVVEIVASTAVRLPNAVRGHLTVARADRPEVVTSAGMEFRPGPSPVGQPLSLPIVLEPYRHENGQFGYAPDYVANEVYFDPSNRPVIRQRTENKYLTTGLMVFEEGRWVERSFVEALRAAYPSYRGTYFGAGFWGAKVVFDGDGDAYTLVRAMVEGGARSVLLHTADRGRSYTVHELPDGQFNHEQFTGHNTLSDPPPILVHHQTADFPGDFAQVNDLLLVLPRKRDGVLDLGEPVLVSSRDLGPCQHSGGPAATATREGKTHIVWGEVTEEKVPGVPTYVATYDHAARRLSPKLLLGYAPPINDVHNAPGICLDSQGYLHMVSGAHGDTFWYRRSLRPNDSSAWTEPEPVLTAGYRDPQTDADGSGRQTYLSLVCGPDDTLHIAYRQWRQGVDGHHGGANYAALSYQRKPSNGPWSPARPMVVPVRPGYSIYYHKLTIDRVGRLFLSYSYLTQDATYQADFPELYHDPAVMTSADGGQTWKLAETADLVGRPVER